MVEYEVGEARIRLDGRERTVLVAFGPEGATALLGATTLELFNMAVGPVRRRLVPVPGLLKESLRLDPARPHWFVTGSKPLSSCRSYKIILPGMTIPTKPISWRRIE
jgi:hypothetical protein